jgi:adenylyltransferase/sulfurtransferase
MEIETFDLFSRQTPFIGMDKQAALSKAKVAVVGAGGLGSHVSSLLVRAGVGVVRIIDRDMVEYSNLPRTAMYDRSHIGKAKAFVAAQKLGNIVSGNRVDGMIENVAASNAKDVLAGFDVVVDCTDNMDSRYVINKFCVRNKVPWVYGAVLRDEGFSSTFRAGGRPCLNCIYRMKTKETEKTEQAGVLGPAVAMVASWQAMEVIKLITGLSEPNYGRLLRIKLDKPIFEFLDINKQEECEICGKNLPKNMV